MTNKSYGALLVVVMLAVIAIPIAYGTEVATNTNFSSVALTAEDVNCADCHTENPHTIHKTEMDTGKVTCEACHGEALEIGIPQCTKCHSGPIHDVHHVSKGADCTVCHKDVEKIHHDAFGGKKLLCSHCHGDIIATHGGGMDSCDKCHGTTPNIVLPEKSAGMTIKCQICHNYDDAASIHGDLSDPTGCYKCHRTAPNSTPENIPHNIHLPLGVGCEACHVPSGGSEVGIPQCSNCHDAVGIHELSKIGLSATMPDCTVCHGKPPEKTVKATATAPPAKPTPTEKGPAEAEATATAGKKLLPGFAGLFAVAALLSAIYWRRR